MVEARHRGSRSVEDTPRHPSEVALNTAGFAEFLAKHPEASMSSDREIAERFERFTKKETLAVELKSLFGKQIKKDFGIELNDEDLAQVGDALESLAIHDSERLQVVHESVDLFKKLPQEIAGLEAELGGLGNSTDLAAQLERLRIDHGKLETVSRYGLGRFFNPHQIDTFAAIKEKHGLSGKKQIKAKMGEVREKIEQIEDTLSRIEGFGLLRQKKTEAYEGLRTNIIGNVAVLNSVVGKIHERVAQKLKEALDGEKSLEELDTAQAEFERLKTASSESETRVNALGTVDEEEYQRGVDTKIEAIARGHIENAVNNIELGSGTYDRLQRSLEKFLRREKIGSKEGDEARYFIIDALEGAMDKLDASVEGRAKRLLCERIIANLAQIKTD